ncbi:hypothetical protein M406DRAFT_99365 [Cryphonectria parasitica EP155]|uniref:LIM zinc-binding domain-containing protein n=1 Tax=Cryphonectria parasitica (strain ATCC 38755 / EP155) TaxID=660469 RepID=A0A9P4XU96_CRYP1|nr:uncharacterized protein M406DRAFT_99365 [Cryphonectria parasitica EP155]KAF3760770.1 hypothetical protein M406DRAFT_99365 [Cryphonectria parasitica EP155]
MPSIKCSSCGQEIEISMMGDHVCAGPGGGRAYTTRLVLYRPSIPPLRPADPHWTDRSYSRQPRTPMSLSSGSRSVSPRTPGARPSIGRADDYFAPTIAVNDEPGLPQSRPGAYGGFGDMEPEPAYPVTSPKKQGLNLLTRIDSISAGPYAQDIDSPPPVSGMRGPPPRQQADNDGYSTSASSNGMAANAPPRMPRNNGYGGFGPPPTTRRDDQPDSFAALNRSETFPNRPVERLERLEQPLRAPSAPGPRPDRLRDTSRPPPPRTSLVRSPIKNPSINLEAEFGMNNPYHSPSASIASSISRGSSQGSQPSSSTSPPRSATSPRKPSQGGSSFDTLISDVQSSMDELAPKELPPMPELRAPSSPETRSSPKSRGNCKACGLAITGKSVSSADGRLTGRYHKACFVCTSCSAPFQTAEFYVHGDRPFCKLHYHKENGSLCGTCADGIEGQYLEDEGYTKYHVNCFRCGDCQRVLSDGYFEVGGRAYCEKDAWRRLQAARRTPSMSSMSSQRSYGSSPLAPPGRPGMRPPPGAGLPSRPMGSGNGRMGQSLPRGLGGPGMGLTPPMPKMEKRRTRLGMM